MPCTLISTFQVENDKIVIPLKCSVLNICDLHIAETKVEHKADNDLCTNTSTDGLQSETQLRSL